MKQKPINSSTLCFGNLKGENYWFKKNLISLISPVSVQFF